MNMEHEKQITKLIVEMDMLEKENRDVPIIFSEILKNEINANDEQSIYKELKKLIEKYSKDENSISAINDFTRVLSGGIPLVGIMQLSIDEIACPYTHSYWHTRI